MISLLFRAPIWDISGYSEFARNLILRLHKTGKYHIQVDNLVWVNSDLIDVDKKDKKLLMQLCNQKIYYKNTTLLHLSIAHEFKPNCKYNIGFSMLETDRISLKWVHFCNAMDEVFVPSSFNLETFRNSGVVVPMKIQPGGVDVKLFQPDGKVFDLKSQGIKTRFNFLTGGQWGQGDVDRKGIGRIISSFLYQFRGNKEVGLIIKTYMISNSIFDRDFCLKRIRDIKRDFCKKNKIKEEDCPDIYLVHGEMKKEELSELARSCQVAVLPSYEGWGLWHIQLAATGLPIIWVNWSAPVDYLDPKLTLPLKPILKPISNILAWKNVYEPDHMCAFFDLKQLCKSMQESYDKYKLYKEKALEQSEIIRKNWSWDKAAEKLDYHLNNRGFKYFDKLFYPKKSKVAARKKIAIIFVTYNKWQLTKQCIESIIHNTQQSRQHIDYELIVVDNNSTDETRQQLQNQKFCYAILNNENKGFAKACNQGVTFAKEQFGNVDYLFLNNDTIVCDAYWLTILSDTLYSFDDKVACVGPKCINLDGNIMSAGTLMPTNTFKGHNFGGLEMDRGQYNYVKKVQGVSGCCMLWKQEVFDELKGFDERYFMYYEETEMMLRAIEAGYTILYNGLASIIHMQHGSMSPQVEQYYNNSRDVFMKDWKEKLTGLEKHKFDFLT